MGRRGCRNAEPTDGRQELLTLSEWPGQRACEESRPPVLLGGSVTERARETNIPEWTVYRRVQRFEKGRMLGLLAGAAGRHLPKLARGGSSTSHRSFVHGRAPLPPGPWIAAFTFAMPAKPRPKG